METERRSPLKIVGRGQSSESKHAKHAKSHLPSEQASAQERWSRWEDRMRSELSRVHALIDLVNCEADRMLADDSMHAIHVLEKNAELRELQAYSKGLRFAMDRQKDKLRPGSCF